MSRTVFLFPGQGAQGVGMGRDFAEAFAPARETFDRAAAALGWDVAGLCFDGPQEELNRTAISQPAILTVSLAIYRVLAQELPDLVESCAAVAGLSLGEYSALVAADALDFEDAVRLVQKRGEFMEAACGEREGAMISILGLDGDTVRALCEEHGAAEVVAANFNNPGQVVISGAAEAVGRVAAACSEKGAKRTIPLAVSGAFHSPFMNSAAERLRPELAATDFRPAAVPVIANANAEYVTEPGAFRSGLASQIISPVLWQQSMERLIADGCERFVEIGPGNVLAGLMRRIDRRADIVNVASVEALRQLKDG